MSAKNSYDTLYDNLRNKFTVVYEGCECTLGDYMLIKAGKRQAPGTAMPTPSVGKAGAITDIVDYVATQFTVKNAPAREKTIKRFPLRSSLSAMFTAAAACALVFSFGIFTLNNSNALSPYTADSSEVEVSENNTEETISVKE